MTGMLRRLYSIIIGLLVVAVMQGATMADTNEVVTKGVFDRILHLRFPSVGNGDSEIGTGFTIEVDERQYLITAKHLTDRWAGSTVDIWNNGWKTIDVQIVGKGSENEDVIVLSANTQLTAITPIAIGMGNIAVSQNIRFLGFPLGLSTKTADDLGKQDALRRIDKLPLVKGGILSGIQFGDEGAWLSVDGHNNRGFSGGPVIFKDISDPQGPWWIAGVISGFRLEGEYVYDLHDRKKTIGVVGGNSGILIATGMQTAQRLIAENPIGYPVR